MASRSRDIHVFDAKPGARADLPVSHVVRDDQAAEGVEPDHHLWRNGRLWWVAFTVHHGHLQERVRFSLGTDDVLRARELRDRVFNHYAAAEDCKISIRLRAPRAKAHKRRSGGSARRAD